jgi:hypothetical protein
MKETGYTPAMRRAKYCKQMTSAAALAETQPAKYAACTARQ